MNRTANEDQSLAEVDRLAVNIRQARKVNRALLIFVLLVAALLVGFNFPKPADAAKRNVYKGTVTICYSPSSKSDPYSMYLTKQWRDQLPAAAKKVAGVKVRSEREPLTTCAGAVRIGSSPYAQANGAVSRTAAYRVYKYGEGGEMWESQIGVSDKVGAKLTAAQRQAELVKAIRAAVPR